MKTSRQGTWREVNKRAGSWVLSDSQADQVKGKTGKSGYSWLPGRPHPQHMQGILSLPHILASDYHRLHCGQAWLLKSLHLFQKETTETHPTDKEWAGYEVTKETRAKFSPAYLKASFPCSPVMLWNSVTVTGLWQSTSFPCFSYVYQSFSFTESFWNCLRLEKLKVGWSQSQLPVSELSLTSGVAGVDAMRILEPKA